MRRILFLSTLILLTAAQLAPSATTNLVGGYASLSDLSSPDFQNVLAFIYANYPNLTNYQPTSVRKQLVNGQNYLVNLQNADGCTAQVTVYSTFQGDLSISAFSQPPCPPSNPTSTPASTSTQVFAGPVRPISFVLGGGWTVQPNPLGPEFENALGQALAQNSYLRSDLVLTETQVVAGMNYRFTFRNTDGTFNQIVIYIPIGGALEVFPASAGSILPRLAPIPISGGWTPVTALRSALDALNAVYKQHPQVKQYFVSGVEKQVVNGINYRVGLQNNTQGVIKYALFNVFFDLSKNVKVTQRAWVDVRGFSVPQLGQNYQNSLELHSQLRGFTLTEVVNIWQGEALRFTFANGGKRYRVFIYSNRGKLNNLIFPF